MNKVINKPRKKITRTDGKRTITLTNTGHKEDIALQVCRNGYQTTELTIDKDMLRWIETAILEYNLYCKDIN